MVTCIFLYLQSCSPTTLLPCKHFICLNVYPPDTISSYGQDAAVDWKLSSSLHSEKKEEPKRLLRGTIFLSAEQTPLWHCFGSSFSSGAIFLNMIMKKNGPSLTKRSRFSKRLLWGTILAPLFFWVYPSSHLVWVETLQQPFDHQLSGTLCRDSLDWKGFSDPECLRLC